MLFTSLSFLFFFLPCLFFCYFLVPRKLKNYILLIFSLFFYFFGEKQYLILLLGTCLFNYFVGRLLNRKHRKFYFLLGLIGNIGILFYFKYTNFFLKNVFFLMKEETPFLNIILPLGISFFTFQNLSYIIDVYKKEISCQKNFFTYCMYITLFPQLVAGPIVRYQDVCSELENRKESIKEFSEGVTRFIFGLTKKVIIADSMYLLSTKIMADSMTIVSYWLVAIGFTLQIYYDFSGYSDMAIGLGKMFGFHFKENFNYPLISSSITEFWKRWHMSLSSFFKDYVYIPLGGNRLTKTKQIRNLFIVWFLTGFWHGASWNFIIWGMYFFVFLLIEKFLLKKRVKNGLFSHIYTFMIITISFVIFSFTDLNEMFTFLKGMFNINNGIVNRDVLYHLKNNGVLLLIALIGCSPLLKNTIQKIKKGKSKKWLDGIEIVSIFLVFLLSIAKILSSSFQPFIYFRF